MGVVLFRLSDYTNAEFGWPCGGTFIPNRSKCWTDPKTGRKLKKPLTYQVYQKIQGSKGKAAQKLYKDREQAIRDRRRAAVPGWKKQQAVTANKIPLPDKNQPFSVQESSDFHRALLHGEVTPEHIKINWERFKNSKENLKLELNKLTKDELKKLNSGYVWSNSKKDDLVKGAIETIEDRFIPGAISYDLRPGSKEAAIEKAVGSWTQEDINKRSESFKAALAARKAKIEQVKSAIDSPQTLEDFETKKKYGKEPLTPEQQRQYDELVAEKSRSDRASQVEQKGKIEAIQHDGIKMTMRQTKHTKQGHDLHVVSLDERVDRDTYNKLNERAKKLGGYYSAYNKDGAIPGFQFKDPEKAKEFLSLDELNKGTERQQDKQQAASERLTALSETLKDDAQERLGRDRLANTARRARMAASAEADAAQDLFIADTMQNVADAISEGRAKYLSGINSKAQIEQLESILKRGHYDYAIEQSNKAKEAQRYARYEDFYQQPITDEAVTRVKYPYPNVRTGDIKDIIDEVKNKPGLKALSQKMEKRYKEARRDDTQYGVKFERPEDIEELRQFLNRAERHVSRGWGLKEAKEQLQNYDRIRRTGINSPEELRTALREYMDYRGNKRNADPIKKLERDLVGRKIEGYFPTPDKLADRLAEVADVQPGQKVLEPSAGKGSLADAIRRKYGSDSKIDTIEVNGTLANLLKAKGYDPKQEDFLSLKDQKYDRIVMNPPFERGQDIEHVRHAYDLLEPGGKVVAIMSEGPFFRSDSKATEFREWMQSRGGKSEKLPEGSFKTSDNPTGVNTRLVVLEKPGAKAQKKAELPLDSGYERLQQGEPVELKKGDRVKGVYMGLPFSGTVAGISNNQSGYKIDRNSSDINIKLDDDLVEKDGWKRREKGESVIIAAERKDGNYRLEDSKFENLSKQVDTSKNSTQSKSRERNLWQSKLKDLDNPKELTVTQYEDRLKDYLPPAVYREFEETSAQRDRLSRAVSSATKKKDKEAAQQAFDDFNKGKYADIWAKVNHNAAKKGYPDLQADYPELGEKFGNVQGRSPSTSSPALNLDGNYTESSQPKEAKKAISSQDVKNLDDREALAKQELAEAKKSGDKTRVKAWEEEAKRTRIAKLKSEQQAQKNTQTTLFNPLVYDKDVNDSPLLSGLYQPQAQKKRQITPERIDKANTAVRRQIQKINQQQTALRAEVARARNSGDDTARVKAATALAPLQAREAKLIKRSNRIRRLDPRLSENSQPLKRRAEFARGGWQCGKTFIPYNRKCYTDPKTGIKLKTPITYKEYTKRRAQVYRDAQRGQLPQNDYDRQLLQSVSDRQAKLKTQKEKLQLTQAAASVGAKQVLPSGIAEVEVSKLQVDPKRFQYKILGAQTSTGSVGSLSGVKTWDANLAGIIQVWQDPKDKQVYVVNGHNRTERAKALGVKTMTAKFIKAKSPQEARAVGALTNVAEGRGTSLDAAKFFRDSGLSRQDLERKGIPMREKIATDGLALSNLSEPLFNRVVQGSLPEQRAVTIGASLKDHKQQQELVDLIEKEEKRGKKINNDTIAELTDMVVGAPKVQESQGGLFDLLGFTPETRSLAVEKAQIQAGIKRQLAREKKLFGTVGRSRAAEELSKAGNQINVDESAQISETAAKALEAFDKEKNLSGDVSSAVNRAAERIANGENPKKVEKETYDEILTSLQKTYRFGEGSGTRVAKRRIGDNSLAASRYPGKTAEFGEGRRLKRRLKSRKKFCCCQAKFSSTYTRRTKKGRTVVVRKGRRTKDDVKSRKRLIGGAGLALSAVTGFSPIDYYRWKAVTGQN